jgi:hypothetical protein
MLSDWATAYIEARREILLALYRFDSRFLSKHRTLSSFSLLYNVGRIPVSRKTRRRYPHCSKGTLNRWIRACEAGGMAALTPRYGNRLGQGLIARNAILRSAIRAQMRRADRPSAPAIMAALRTRLPNHKLPSVWTVGGFIRRERLQSRK